MRENGVAHARAEPERHLGREILTRYGNEKAAHRENGDKRAIFYDVRLVAVGYAYVDDGGYNHRHGELGDCLDELAERRGNRLRRMTLDKP